MSTAMIQTFRAKFPELQAVEVAVLSNGKPTDEHGFVVTESGRIIDADTFLALYEPAQTVGDSATRAKRPYHRKVKAKAKAEKPRKVAEPPESEAPPARPEPERQTIAGAIRQALANGPKDLRAMTDYVQAHGFESADERQVGNNAYQLRRAGKIAHSDNGIYSLPEA